MNFADNPQLKLAYDFVQHSGCHVFLTGKAGTGKTTFLRNLKKESPKRMVVLAPTGVAAVNAGGVTIHSFFQLPFGPQLPDDVQEQPEPREDPVKASAAKFQRFSREKINIIRSLDLLVIDEISMVRADLLDAVDTVLRRHRNRLQAFGGVQLLMIGDLQQLPPVVKEEDWDLLRPYYDTMFFFGSRALKKTEYVGIELKKIYRQQDEAFIRLLNRVRDNAMDKESFQELNRRYVPGFKPPEQEGYITLTTHNYQAQECNRSKLDALKGKARAYQAAVSGEFPELSFPTEAELTLKVGAQVMFIKNDLSPLKEYYNGKIGTVTRLAEDRIYVQCKGDQEAIGVGPMEWQNCRYALDEETKQIKETVIGTFTQFPLKPAWAITIHKSQGLTFEKAVIDAHAAFAHGQVYVALSRCRSLEGLVLSAPLSGRILKIDENIRNFTRQIEEHPPGEEQLAAMKNAYQKSLVQDLFDFSALQRRLRYLHKLLHEQQASVDASWRETLKEPDRILKAEAADVSVKFMKQVERLCAENPDVENNALLQERIRKACVYFAPRIESIAKALPEGDIESDNKAARKSLREALNRLRSEAAIKTACLRVCEKGFKPIVYLETKAKAAIEKPEKEKSAQAPEEFGIVAHPDFYALLKKWRDRKAERLELPAHMVLPRRTMREIAHRLPMDRKALLKIKGVGEKKAARFGIEILELIADYRKKNDIPVPPEDLTAAEAGTPKKGETQRISLDLFLSGRSIAEIAAARNLAIGTVEGHLSVFVGTGELAVEKLVAAEKIKRIADYFAQSGDTRLGPAKAFFDDEVSYGEIKCVLKHLESRKTGENDLKIRRERNQRQ